MSPFGRRRKQHHRPLGIDDLLRDIPELEWCARDWRLTGLLERVQAAEFFERIYAENVDFRDVATRVRENVASQ